jgi:multiple sugar transport system permease protein
MSSADPGADSAKSAPGKSRLGVQARRERRAAALLTLPAWGLLITLFAVPLGYGIYLSLRDESLVSVLAPKFVGLKNYRNEVGAPEFSDAAIVSLKVLVLGLLIQFPIGIGLALLLARGLRGTWLFRSALLIPMLLTPVAVGLMWRFMFDTDVGVIDWVMTGVGLPRIDWLGDRTWALIAVVIVDSWGSIPFVMLLVLAGLLALPETPFEAAHVDGASAWQRFRYVTWPLLRPVLFVVLMIRMIDIFKLFDIVFVVTARGNPGTSTQTLGLLNYNTFFFGEISRAAAIGIALTIITLPVYALWLRSVRASNA